ncbi:MAG TPA: hypothetical protein DGG95_17775 [Cytophagales bacterium]|jgi:hypothetical protein|nr:hypothetical protein [Cytophagales bacterium]
MKSITTLVLIYCGLPCSAQLRSETATASFSYNSADFLKGKKTFWPGVFSDPVQNYKSRSPVLTNYLIGDWRTQTSSFWAGTTTYMTFNKGKFGTIYYWDVQGNLRGTRGFIDISGKNKRGFKLVFPWRKF